MRIILFCFIFALCSVSLLMAQYSVEGQVIDQASGQPIPYANIGLMGSNKGTVSNDQGYFKLTVRAGSDTLMFNNLGYTDKMIKASSISAEKPIALSVSSLMLDLINVSGKEFTEAVILGARNENGRGPSIGFGNPQLGVELGTVIKIERETLIKSVNFVLNHAKGDSLLLRVNIYDYADGSIGSKLLDQNVFLRDKQQKGLYTIDFTDYNLTLSNNVLLSLEWLENFNGQGNELMTFDMKKSKRPNGIFIRLAQTAEFQRIPRSRKYKPCIYFVGKQ